MTDPQVWLEWRRQGIGASDVAALLGISPYNSPLAVYMEKTGEISSERDSEYIEFGHRAEAMIADWFHDKTGLYVVGPQFQAENPHRPWMRCTVDGFVAESASPDRFATPPPHDDMLGLLEIKTTRPGPAWDEIPDHYEAQVQWQMAVTGYDHAWVAVLHGRSFRIYELDRDDIAIAGLVKAGEAFWQLVQDGTPPRVDYHRATTEALKQRYPSSLPESETSIDELEGFWRKLRDTKADLKQLHDIEHGLENELKAALADHEAGTIGGQVAVTWKNGKSIERLDEKKLRELRPDVWADFAREHPGSRRLLLKNLKGDS